MSVISALLVAVGLVLAVPTAAAALGTLSVNPVRAIAGETVSFSGDMTPDRRPVVLQRQNGNNWVDVTRLQQGAIVDDFRFSIAAPASTTTYRVFAPRTTISGRTYAAASTPIRTLTVVAQAATLTLPTTVAVGAPNVRARAQFRPARVGRPVQLQRQVGASWVAAGSATQSSDGVATVIVDTTVAGTFNYRAVAMPWQGAARHISPTRTMIVAAVPNPPPPVPTGVQTSGGHQVIHVTWSAVVAADLAGYRVWQANSPTGVPTPLTAGPVALTSRDVSAPNGVVRYFSVSAVDTSGNESQRSAQVPGMAIAETTPPPVPTGLTGIGGNTQVTLTWSPVTAPDLDGYVLYLGASSANLGTKLTPTPVTGTTYTASGLVNGTQYWFAVASVDDLGNESAKSTPVPVTPTDSPPPAPTGVAVAPGNTQVTVSWSPVNATDLAGYEVSRGPSNTGPWTVLTAEPVPEASYVATGLTNATTYWFVVRAVDVNGNYSDYSAPVAGTPTAPAEPGEWRQLSAGAHTCGVKNVGSLWCWGNNGSGQLGVGGDPEQPLLRPVQVGTETYWASVAAGAASTCAIRNGGSLWCWGNNGQGQLGTGDTVSHDTPVEVAPGTTWRAVDVGVSHACGVRADGGLWCWGANFFGQLGNNGTTEQPAPVRVGLATSWTSVSTGPEHTCAVMVVMATSTLWCWGSNGLGQLGGTPGDKLTPSQVTGSPAFGTAVDTGDQFTCGLKADASLWCFGIPYSSQLGGPGGGGVTKIHVSNPSTWRSVTTGTEHACGVRTDSSAWCWGRNDEGRTAAPAPTTTELPTQVLPGSSWRSLTAGAQHTCGIRGDGSAWCWGKNGSGELGDGTNLSRHSPEVVDP